MERGVDLSRQGLAQIAHVPRDVVRKLVQDGEPYALSLAHNRLMHLNGLYVFSRVVQLDLSGNKLQSLDGIEELVHLQSLNVSRNGLEDLDAIASLQSLRVLNVAENSLTQLDAVQHLKTYVAVDASYNSIAKWPLLGPLSSLESLDLSSNMLEAFPVGAGPRIFPSSLRRLSVAQNQIQELCGIASLGSVLHQLQIFKTEGNPATQRIIREGGSLDFMWVNLFASVSFPLGSGSRRDDFVCPRDVVDTIEDAVQSGDEHVLTEFLLTGTIPVAPAKPAVLRPSAHVGLSWAERPPISQASKVTEPNHSGHLTAQPAAPASSLQPPPAPSDGLTKESKMEMWKKMMNDRKQQEQQERVSVCQPDYQLPPRVAPVIAAPPSPKRSPAPTEHNHQPRSTPPPTAAHVIHKEPTKPASALPPSVPPPQLDTLMTQIKSLNEQMSGMRKYVNAWIKREQFTRVAAAKRIQRFIRHRRWRRHLMTLVDHSRLRHQHEYGVQHFTCPLIATASLQRSPIHRYAVEIQRHVRGWLSRDRVSRWMYYTQAAARIQHWWRHRRGSLLQAKRELGLSRLKASPDAFSMASVTTAVALLAVDVAQLQRVFVVQEQMLATQWAELAQYKHFVHDALDLPVARFQGLWRGYWLRRRLGIKKRTTVNIQQDQGVAELKRELSELKGLVHQLLEQQRPKQVEH